MATQPTWLIVNSGWANKVEVQFVNPPNAEASTPGNPTPEFEYVLKVYMWDAFNELTPQVAEVDIILLKNMPPYLVPPTTALPPPTPTRIPFAMTPYTFSNTMFQDDEGDPILISMAADPVA